MPGDSRHIVIGLSRIEQIAAFDSHEEHGEPGFVTMRTSDRDGLVNLARLQCDWPAPIDRPAFYRQSFDEGAAKMRERIEFRLREMIDHFKATERSLVENGKVEDSWTMRDHAEAYKNVLGVIEGVSKENLWLAAQPPTPKLREQLAPSAADSSTPTPEGRDTGGETHDG